MAINRGGLQLIGVLQIGAIVRHGGGGHQGRMKGWCRLGVPRPLDLQSSL